MKKIFKKSFNCHCCTCQSTLSFREHQPEESHDTSTKRFFASHCSALNYGKSTGFTLAEVLITLTIIGVIAALTIPNLMQSYKKHQIETNLKASYTILQNAITMAQSEHGSLQEMLEACNHDDRKARANCFTNNYLKPYLKYSKSCACEDFNCKGIFPVEIIKKLDGTTENSSRYEPKYHANIKLDNGILLGVQWFSNTAGAPHFLVDVNGWNGPNQIGIDNFYFTLEDNNSETTAGLRCGLAYYNPVTYTLTCSTAGNYCSCPIMYNGWKIPDDYPVKKF